MVLEHRSVDLPDGAVEVNGFIIDMAKVFEDFVTAALTESLERIDGRVSAQDPQTLDQGGIIGWAPARGHRSEVPISSWFVGPCTCAILIGFVVAQRLAVRLGCRPGPSVIEQLFSPVVVRFGLRSSCRAQGVRRWNRSRRPMDTASVASKWVEL